MKKTTPITFFAMLLTMTMAFGQEYTFKVLLNKGKNEIKSGNTWQPIRVGAELRPDDVVRIAENSYLGLIHATGKPLDVKESGQYTVANLSAKVGKGSSVLNKYAEFILSTSGQKNKLAATGAVHRGPDKIDVHLPQNSAYIFGDTIAITWEKDESIPGPYLVILTNLWGDELMKIETEANSILVNLREKTLANTNDIQVEVYSTKVNKKSDQVVLRKFSKGDSDRVGAEYRELVSEIGDNSVLSKLYKAAFFEEKKLLVDAATAFRQAIEMGPDLPSLWEDYESFLMRNGLKPLPKK